MAKTITKLEENHVIISETVKVSDRVETEEFDQKKLDKEIVKAKDKVAYWQARVDLLEGAVQMEMDKQI